MTHYDPDSRYIAKLDADHELGPRYVFTSIHVDEGESPLGEANLRTQGLGTEDEDSWFEGYFDTKRVVFDDAAQLHAWGLRHGYYIEVE